MFCKKCGKEIMDEAIICVHCGCETGNSIPGKGSQEPDIPSGGLCFLSFLIPLVGFILYGTNHSAKPISAKKYLKWAIISIISYAVIVGVFYGILFASMM